MSEVCVRCLCVCAYMYDVDLAINLGLNLQNIVTLSRAPESRC